MAWHILLIFSAILLGYYEFMLLAYAIRSILHPRPTSKMATTSTSDIWSTFSSMPSMQPRPTPHPGLYHPSELLILISNLESLDLTRVPGGAGPWRKLIGNLRNLTSSIHCFNCPSEILLAPWSETFIKKSKARNSKIFLTLASSLGEAFLWTRVAGSARDNWSDLFAKFHAAQATTFYRGHMIDTRKPTYALVP